MAKTRKQREEERAEITQELVEIGVPLAELRQMKLPALIGFSLGVRWMLNNNYVEEVVEDKGGAIVLASDNQPVIGLQPYNLDPVESEVLHRLRQGMNVVSRVRRLASLVKEEVAHHGN